MKAKKSKLRTVFGRNRNDAIHAIMYKLTNPLFEEAVGYYLLEQISTWSGTRYKVLKYVVQTV